jgi:hypothetical protein
VPALTPPATIAAALATVPPPPTGLPAATFAPPSLPAAPPAATPAAGPSELPAARNEYAVDIGSALTIDALRVRWNSIRFGRAQLFEGLQPLVAFSDNHKTSRVELHLVVGPLPNEAAAMQLCSVLAVSRILCQPTMFDGHRMALR